MSQKSVGTSTVLSLECLEPNDAEPGVPGTRQTFHEMLQSSDQQICESSACASVTLPDTVEEENKCATPPHRRLKVRSGARGTASTRCVNSRDTLNFNSSCIVPTSSYQ